MKQARMIIDRAFKVSEVDREFMGPLLSILAELFMMEFISREIHYQMRMVFRTDVLNMVKELNVPIVRYPGGNFVSNFSGKTA